LPFDGDATIIGMHIEAVDKLRYGHAQIAAGRWCQGGYSDAAGSRCAVGWIDVAAMPMGGRSLALEALYDALPPSAKKLSLWATRCITLYNDTHSRKSVLALYERAIAMLEP